MKPGETGPRNSILCERSGRGTEVLALSRLIGFALAFVVLMAACAYTPRTPRATDNRVITRYELSSIAVGNLYEAIERLRPLWLYRSAPRSLALPTAIAVVQDGLYFGGTESLRYISPLEVSRIELLDGPAAVAAVPGLSSARHVEAAIVLQFLR